MDHESLAQALIEVLESPQKFIKDVPQITRHFAPDSTARQYEETFEALLRKA